MSIGVKCFVPDCENPVIGQCSGYKDSCGQFYCPTHSRNKLCSECDARKVVDETYEDYLQTAGSLGIPGASKVWAIIFTIIAVIVAMSGGDASALWIIAILLFLFVTIRYIRANNAIANLDKTKPGFSEFCQLYKKKRRKAFLSDSLELVAGVIGGGIAGAVQGTAEAIGKEAYYQRKVREGTPSDVAHELQDLKKKIDRL